MALEEYQRKRDFRKTPEPPGTTSRRKKKAAALSFVDTLSSEDGNALRGTGGDALLAEVSSEEYGVSLMVPDGWEAREVDSWHANIVSPDGNFLAFAAVPIDMGPISALLNKAVSKGKTANIGDWTCSTGVSPTSKKWQVAICGKEVDSPEQILIIGLTADKNSMKHLGGAEFVVQLGNTAKGFQAPPMPE